MRTLATFAALGAAANLFCSTAALASERTFRIEANSTHNIDINVCSSSVDLRANGDDDTDLDFWIYDSRGNLVHSDTDSTDLTYYTINDSSAGGGRCVSYRMEVRNYGDVYNNMELSLTDRGVSTNSGGQTGIYADTANKRRVSTQTVRVEANATQSYTLNLCAPSVYLEVRGDGDTDLDFWVTDPNGNQVHSDTDSTDITFATLNNGRSSGTCAAYRLRIQNFGNVYNEATITLTEQ